MVIKIFAPGADPEDLSPANLFGEIPEVVSCPVIESGKTTDGQFFVVADVGDRLDWFELADQSVVSPSKTEEGSPRRKFRKVVVSLILATGLAIVGISGANHYRADSNLDINAEVHSVSFQQGVDHGFGEYHSNRHVRIMSVHGNLESNELTGRVATDGGSNGRSILQSLFAFDDIIGDAPGMIPGGSRIKSATLRFTVTNQGDTPVLFQMATDWKAEELTFKDAKFNGNTQPGIQVDDAEAFVSPAIQIPHGLLGTVEVDVSESLQKWADGRDNFGWVLRASGTDAWGAEGIDVEPKTARPLLVVEYEVPPHE